jgi:hypothetical protein
MEQYQLTPKMNNKENTSQPGMINTHQGTSLLLSGGGAQIGPANEGQREIGHPLNWEISTRVPPVAAPPLVLLNPISGLDGDSWRHHDRETPNPDAPAPMAAIRDTNLRQCTELHDCMSTVWQARQPLEDLGNRHQNSETLSDATTATHQEQCCPEMGTQNLIPD